MIVTQLGDELEWAGRRSAAYQNDPKRLVDVAVCHRGSAISQSVRRAKGVEMEVVCRAAPALGDQVAVNERFERIDDLDDVAGICFEQDVFAIPHELARAG